MNLERATFTMLHAIAEVLSNRGHNITFLLPIGSGESVSKYNDKFQFITLGDRCRVQKTIIYDTVRQAQDMTIQSSTFSMETIKLPINLIIGYIHSLATGTEDYLCDVAVTDLLKSKFDLVMIEGSYLWIHGLLNRFNVPYALLTTCAPSPLTNSWNRAPNLPSVLPGFMAHTNHRKPMSFFWRLYSTFLLSASQVFFTTIADRTMVTAASAYVADVVVPPTVSFSRSDLWLTNADYATDVPRPYLPNTVMVGGLSIEEAKPLTEEFQTIADGANTHGLLVVSMGTVVTGVSQQQTDAMAAAFARLPQTVIWKTPTPRPTVIGNNTLLRSWIPQKGLLGKKLK
ncbi:hypothetical protein BSL78_29230 [Apostichopus japonicus]|uniref:Uncharacterized protein n=1 Tax=Stichopus japonicus TaxID=307972 RepID=A0A2G8JDY2_STIJA|nr:hypothetical protein BSL78_29230 [Apostichopus japonicus]